MPLTEIASDYGVDSLRWPCAALRCGALPRHRPGAAQLRAARHRSRSGSTSPTAPFRSGLTSSASPGMIVATSGSGCPAAAPRRRRADCLLGDEARRCSSARRRRRPTRDDRGRSADSSSTRRSPRRGCSTPLIALNELNGADRRRPWTPTNCAVPRERARADAAPRPNAVRARSCSSTPRRTPAARRRDWWRQAAQVGDLVPGGLLQRPVGLSKQGVILGSRRMRRRSARRSPPTPRSASRGRRLGFVLGFQSGPGAGGREGLQPSSAWFEFVKLEALAAKQVAAELASARSGRGAGGRSTSAGADPDKRGRVRLPVGARPEPLRRPAAAGPASTTL